MPSSSVAALLLATPVLAADPPPYLTPSQLDLTIMLPPPPAAGSALEESELSAVVAIQKNASADRIALANSDANETVFDMYTRTFGSQFTPDKLPKATVFFLRALNSEDDVTAPAKTFFARTRPVPGRRRHQGAGAALQERLLAVRPHDTRDDVGDHPRRDAAGKIRCDLGARR